MRLNRFKTTRLAVLCGTVLLSSAAVAGPPLLCHPFEIGGAKSLPWGSGNNFNSQDPNYDVSRLVPDTLQLLGSDTPVIVRMETLRRAALYITKDERAGYKLLAHLAVRATGKTDALALFDLGYLIESLKQVAWITKRNLAEGLDGVALVEQALHSGGDRAAMEFAASLMGDHVRLPNDHFRNAQRGAPQGSLLARNLAEFDRR